VEVSEQDRWVCTLIRPEANILQEFIGDLYKRRIHVRAEPVRCPLPAPKQGRDLEKAINFINDLPPEEFERKNVPLDGIPGKLALLNVVACFGEALAMTNVPVLPFLVCQWITANIRTSKKVGREKEMRT
jgi:hypothetical protein